LQRDEMESRDQALLSAIKLQIQDMTVAGNIKPADQLETFEGFGGALGAARLGKGMAASISARAGVLKIAIADAQALIAAEKAAAQISGASTTVVVQSITADLSSVWRLPGTARGVAIESNLAQTEYKEWFNVGQLNNGKFPLVDFQYGNTLVSLKTIDTAGGAWFGRMQDHIYELGKNGATVNGARANMVLDIRVQPGGAAAAQPLVQYGAKNNVTVIVKEYP
ncbi:hypothetical protein H7U20_24810, partial [Rugamonas sp. CCM 8940]|nr:hypothetical protein [Rugamonas sp. CCM 8940]